MPASLTHTFEHNCAIVQSAILRRPHAWAAAGVVAPRRAQKLGKYPDFTFARISGHLGPPPGPRRRDFMCSPR